MKADITTEKLLAGMALASATRTRAAEVPPPEAMAAALLGMVQVAGLAPEHIMAASEAIETDLTWPDRHAQRRTRELLRIMALAMEQAAPGGASARRPGAAPTGGGAHG